MKDRNRSHTGTLASFFLCHTHAEVTGEFKVGQVGEEEEGKV